LLRAAIAASATAYTLIMPLFAGEGLAKRMKASRANAADPARERDRLSKSEKVSLRQVREATVSKVVETSNLGKCCAGGRTPEAHHGRPIAGKLRPILILGCHYRVSGRTCMFRDLDMQKLRLP